MSKVCITYACWAPESFFADPLPHAIGMAEQDWPALIAAYEFCGFDYLVLSAFPDIEGSSSPHKGEYARCKRFLDLLHATSKLTACLYYEPFAERPQVIADRLKSLAYLLEHPAFARTPTGTPRLYYWQVFNEADEYRVRLAKLLYGSPLWVSARVRGQWQENAHPIDDVLGGDSWKLDARHQYPQPAFADGSAMPYATSYNAAGVRANNQEWLLRPDMEAFKAALAKPIDPTADRIFRDGEINEAGHVLIKGDAFAYMLAIRAA